MQDSYQIAHKQLEEQDNEFQEQKVVDLAFKPQIVEDKKLELKQKLIQEQIPVQFVIHENKQNGGVKEGQQQKGGNTHYKHNYQIQQSTDDLEKQQNPQPKEEHADQKHDQNQGNVEEKGRHHGHKLQKPKLYAYRWVILVLYLLGDLGPSMMVTTTTPNANQLSKIYNLLPIEANLGSLVILVFTPIGTIFSSKFLDQKGLSVSIRLGIFVCAIGAWMRCLVNYSYYFVVGGNILTGLGSPFIFNGKTQVSSNWFSHEQGPGVTSFITFWTNLNGIAGMMFAGNFMGSYRYDATNEEEGKTLVFELMLLIAFIVSGIGVLLWVFFKQHPPTPPSFTAQIEREQNFKESVVHLIKNRNYVFIVIQQGLILGSINGMSTSISYFINPYGFDSADSTFMLAAIPIGGVFGIIIGSYFLNKYKKYKYQMGIYMIGGTGCMFLFQLVLYTKSIYLAVGSAAIVGLFFVPLIPAFLEFACESVFPIGEGSAVGFLSSVNGIFSLIYGSVLSFIVKGQSQTQSFLGTIILLSSFGLAFLLLFLTKERLRRDEVEKISCKKFQEGKEVDISDFHFDDDDDNRNSCQASSVQFNANEIEKQERLEQPLQVRQEENQVEIEIPTISQNHNNNNCNTNSKNNNIHINHINDTNNNNNIISHNSNSNSSQSSNNNNNNNHHSVNAKGNSDSNSEQESAFSSSSTTDFSSTDSQQYKQRGDSNKQSVNEKHYLSDSLSQSAAREDQLSDSSSNQNESNIKKGNKAFQKVNNINAEQTGNVSSSKQHSVNNGSSYEEIEESEEEQEDSQNQNSMMDKGLGLKRHLINEKDFETNNKQNKNKMKNGHNN